MSHSSCCVCEWTSGDYSTSDMAGCAATWHVYEAHRAEWLNLFGDNPPRDPDPRLAREVPT